MGNVSVTLLRGDLTAERTDAVVNPTDAGLSLSGAVSRSLLKKGGDQIGTELKRKGVLENYQFGTLCSIVNYNIL